jgi:hypothetical protein
LDVPPPNGRARRTPDTWRAHRQFLIVAVVTGSDELGEDRRVEQTLGGRGAIQGQPQKLGEHEGDGLPSAGAAIHLGELALLREPREPGIHCPEHVLDRISGSV